MRVARQGEGRGSGNRIFEESLSCFLHIASALPNNARRAHSDAPTHYNTSPCDPSPFSQREVHGEGRRGGGAGHGQGQAGKSGRTLREVGRNRKVKKVERRGGVKKIWLGAAKISYISLIYFSLLLPCLQIKSEHRQFMYRHFDKAIARHRKVQCSFRSSVGSLLIQ